MEKIKTIDKSLVTLLKTLSNHNYDFEKSEIFFEGNEALLIWQFIRLNKFYQADYKRFKNSDEKDLIGEEIKHKWGISYIHPYDKLLTPKNFKIYKTRIYFSNCKSKSKVPNMAIFNIENELKAISTPNTNEVPLTITINPLMPKELIIGQIEIYLNKKPSQLKAYFKKVNKRMISSMPLALLIYYLMNQRDLSLAETRSIILQDFKFLSPPSKDTLYKNSYYKKRIEYISSLIESHKYSFI